MKRISASVIAFALVGWTACGGPDLRAAADLGIAQTPTTASLEVRNGASRARAFLVRYSAPSSSVPDAELRPTDTDDRVSVVLIPGQPIQPHSASPAFVLDVYAYRHLFVTVESWDPATGGARAETTFGLPGRTPPLACRVVYRDAGTQEVECE